MQTFSLSFHGGAGTVTGANFLLDGAGKRILVDCGMTQGCKFCEDVNREPFPYDPASIDALFVTHAHIDHIGRIPLLVRRGFKGIIYSTEATRELAKVMLEDSRGVLQKEARKDGLETLYEQVDVDDALKLWEIVPYRTKTNVLDTFEAYFKDAGHILGSAIIEITPISKNEKGNTIAFTGDLGNSPSPLLRDTEEITDAKYVVMESVYGDRIHEDVDERKEKLQRVIEETITRGGVLMIPAFSIERTQILLHEIDSLIDEKAIPKVPVFLDSPLAIKVTEIYRRKIKLFNEGIQDEIKKGEEIFDFESLRLTRTTEESKGINNTPAPKIIIAGAGMSHGGRIQHHEKRYLHNNKNTLLLVGYQAAGSMGRILQDGAKEVKIHGDNVPVRAEVVTLSGYSAHKDRDGLISFASSFSENTEKVFVTMGEPKASLFLVQRLRDYLGLKAVAPKQGETVKIEL